MAAEKSLELKKVSTALKRLTGKTENGDCPRWTMAVEEALDRLPTKTLTHLADLLDELREGVKKKTLPE